MSVNTRKARISRIAATVFFLFAGSLLCRAGEAELRTAARQDGLSRFSTFLVNNAYIAIRDGRLGDAESMIRRALETQPENARLLAIMAEVLEKQENWDEAESIYTRLVTVDPGALPFAQRAFIRLRQGRRDEARLDFQSSLDHDPEDELRQNVEAQLALLSPAAPPVPPTVETAAAPFPPPHVPGELETGGQRLWDILRKAGRWSELERHLGGMLRDDPDNPAILAGRGYARQRLGRQAMAREDFEKAMALEPGEETKRNLAAAIRQIDDQERLEREDARQRSWNAMARRGRWADLEKELDAALAEAPANPALLAQRGFARQNLGRTGEARRDFEAALANNPDPQSRGTIEASLRQMEEQDRLARLEARQREWDEMAAQGHYATLEREISAALRPDPDNPVLLARRGFARQNLNRPDEAREDFSRALSGNPDSDSRAAIQAALRQMDDQDRLALMEARQREWDAMAGRNEWAELERSVGAALEDDPDNPALLAQRGFARQNLRRYSEARADFTRALSGRPDPEAAGNIEAALRQIDADERLAWRTKAAENIQSLQSREDWDGLGRYLDELIGQDPDFAFALASRGYLRSRQERFDEAMADFRAAVAADEPGGEVAAGARDALAGAEREQANRRTADRLEQAAKLIADEQYEAAQAVLDSLEAGGMETAAAASYHFYQAQLLWVREDFEGAYGLYEEALPGLATEFLQSEALWRMASYNQKIENPVLAMNYAARAAALLPDNGVRNSEVGYLFLSYKEDWEAIFYFERALQHMTPTPEQAGIYMDLGYAYQRRGDNPRLHCNIHRYVDLMEVKLAGQAPKYLKDDVENTYAARRVHADMTRRFGAYSGLYNYRRDNGDYASQQINDFYWQPWYKNGRYVQAYFQTIGTLAAKYSGEVYEPLSNSYNYFNQNTHWRETFQTVVGVRVDPSSSLNLVFSLEKAFKIGRLTENDVRVRVGHSWDKGLEWEPCKRNWLYVTTFNEALYSLQHDNLTFVGEERLGRSFRVDPVNPRLVATPYLGISYGYQGRFISKSERWYAEAGPGIHFRKWYREDKYNAPRSYLDVIIQYRIGLTHKRENVLALNVFHSF